MRTGSVRRVLALLALALGPLAVLGVFFLFPVAAMVGQGFVVDGRLDVGGVLDVLARPRVHRVLRDTLLFACAGTLGSLLLGLPAAFVLHRLDLPGRRVVRAALLVPFVLPTVVVGAAFRELLSEGGPLGWAGLDRSPTAIVLGLVFFNAAVVIRMVGAAWEQLDPRPAEAATALGAAPWRVLVTITLPSLRPAVVSAASVVFLFCSTAFGIVLTLGGVRYATVETEIYLLTKTLFDLRAAAALSVLQIAVVTVLLVLTARLRVPTGVRASTVARVRRVQRHDVPALLATGVLLVLVAAPMVALVAGSLRRDGQWSLGNYAALGGVGEDNPLPVPVTEALVVSLRTAVDATWMALLLGLVVALLVTRRSASRTEQRIRSAVDGLFMLPLGVSAVTLGFGFLIALDHGVLDLRNSPLLVPLAQALVALPLVLRTLVPVLGALDERQRQAAASLGAGRWRSWRTVELPALRRPVLAASGFAFAASLGEFGATSFLARESAPTLPVVIFRLLGHPGAHNYPMALAAAVVLAVTTTVVMLGVERLGVRSAGGF